MNQIHNNEAVPAKATIHLTDRQIKYMAARADGKSKKDAARIAGFSETSSTGAIEKSGNLRKALLMAMEAKGLTSEKLAEKMVKGVDATKRQFFTFNGKVQDEREVPDNETQHKFVKTALEVRGDLVQENAKMDLNIGIVSLPQQIKDAGDWNSANTVEIEGNNKT